MPRVRVTVTNEEDRTEQLRIASRIRTEIINQLDVWLDDNSPLRGIHRDEAKHPYFEFVTDEVGEVSKFLNRLHYSGQVQVIPSTEPLGEPCANCGNIAGPKLPPICPNCGFRDIDPCPICGNEVARKDYRKSGSVFTCPHPIDGRYHRVRLAFHEPMFQANGNYYQPLVVVSPVGER